MVKHISKAALAALAMCMVVTSGTYAAKKKAKAKTKAAKKVVIKMGDNLPDRKNGVGAVVEEINAAFKQSHPGVEFEVESYADQPWQDKVKIYATANRLPDIMKLWPFPTLMGPLVDSGSLLPLDKAKLSTYKFAPGALETNVFNGKLYGVPVSMDFWVLFVNKAVFEKAGVPLPKTWEDIIASVQKTGVRGPCPRQNRRP